MKSDLYKPSFAGFVDVDLATKKLSLRSLVCENATHFSIWSLIITLVTITIDEYCLIFQL